MGEKNDRFGGVLLIEDLQGGRPRMEIFGDKRMLIENHCGILEYESTVLRVRCRGMEIIVRGTGLDLAAMSSEELALTGHIATVELSVEGRE